MAPSSPTCWDVVWMVLGCSHNYVACHIPHDWPLISWKSAGLNQQRRNITFENILLSHTCLADSSQELKGKFAGPISGVLMNSLALICLIHDRWVSADFPTKPVISSVRKHPSAKYPDSSVDLIGAVAALAMRDGHGRDPRSLACQVCGRTSM